MTMRLALRQGQRGQIVLAIVLVALLVAVALQSLALRDIRAQEANEAAAMAAARQTVTNLLSLNHETIDDDLARITQDVHGDFREEFGATVEAFAAAVRAERVVSQGEVTGVGIVLVEDGMARVLVAARSSVQNSVAPTAEPRSYRFAVTLVLVDDQWLASELEFVQ